MESFFVSTGVVALAEIGDKTQLLALVLAARYRQPLTIALGVLVATVFNHAVAALVGTLVAGWLGEDLMRWILALSFIFMAGWTLIPDKVSEAEAEAKSRGGVFLTTVVTFFLLEIGDKTQIATVALSARYQDVFLVTLGTTAGMMLANVPAIYLGDVAANRIPLGLVRGVAAALFLGLGILALLDAVGVF